ncbi:iron-sulfur cluster carrier protein ApbC [Alcanivorax sp. 1008]|uniref:iron-sulfur cluster carrier protein ApbC n=1 Tax=Alcanivorax sp. 1008 TaxID=2816853 RepID=UPI001DA42711|nr:iron-sulfur cluster carrier protein ApbC [Alcanivorax sp. 1008]MCC1495655.1 iron-sulfur cluster carrier protein ApbC [Alcanivorax sp. 1008]
MAISEQVIRQALATIVPQELATDLISAGSVHRLDVAEAGVFLEVRLGFPCDSQRARYQAQISESLAPVLGGVPLHLRVDWQVLPHRAQQNMATLDQVSNIIAVSSGKGGVGKSTTAVNLALALQAEGARVGVLDADVFGPSLPLMLGVPEGQRPQVKDGRLFIPIQAHGLQTMSMGYLIDEGTPVVFRGPKASGALLQLVEQTLWDHLDYLIIDMPPGTGDIQLTLAQRVPVAGAVVVTTPQDIALLDAIKGIEMFRKTDIRVLGIVENMAMHVCSNCGHIEHIFGEGGGARVAERYDTALLGSLPLSRAIREQADGGAPTVVAEPDSPEAEGYRQVARRMAARLSLIGVGQRAFPRVKMEH